MATPTADQYAERDLCILRWIKRHQVGLAACLSAVFFEGKQSGHVLRRLAARNWLSVHERELPGGLSYYTLTRVGYSAIGMDDSAIGSLSNAARNVAIAVGCYCAFEGAPGAFRVLPGEVKELMRKPSNVPHVLVKKGADEFVLLRVYHAVGKLKTAKQQVESFFESAVGKPHLAGPVAAHDVGLLVLAPSAAKADDLRTAFSKAGYFERYGALVVGVGPTDETLPAYLRKRR